MRMRRKFPRAFFFSFFFFKWILLSIIFKAATEHSGVSMRAVACALLANSIFIDHLQDEWLGSSLAGWLTRCFTSPMIAFLFFIFNNTNKHSIINLSIDLFGTKALNNLTARSTWLWPINIIISFRGRWFYLGWLELESYSGGNILVQTKRCPQFTSFSWHGMACIYSQFLGLLCSISWQIGKKMGDEK